MTTEAQAVVESARLRHDGERRNPWNEPECGHHYARAMSAWALIVALSGFHYSGVDRKLTLTPRVRAQNFRCFWSAPGGWGRFSLSSGSQTLQVAAEEGSMVVKSIVLNGNGNGARKKVTARLVRETLRAAGREEGRLRVVEFEREIRIAAGQALTVNLGA